MENQATFLPKEEIFDLKKFVFKIIKKWYWIVASVAVCYSIAFMVNRYTEPLYSVSASLLISDDKKSAAEMIVGSMSPMLTKKNIDNEIYTLRSYNLTERAFRELPDFTISYYTVGRIRKPMLYKSAPFKVVIDTTKSNLRNYPVQIEILSKDKYLIEVDGNKDFKKEVRFGEPYISEMFNFIIFLKDSNNFQSWASTKYFFIINDINSLVNNYRNKLSISNIGKGSVLMLSSTGNVPRMEADFLNKFMEVYIRYGLEVKNQTSINTINFIDDQLAMVSDSLQRAENDLWSFKLINKDYDISTEGKFIMDRLQLLQEEKAKVGLQLRYFNYLEEYLQKRRDFHEVVAPAVMGFGDALSNSLVEQLAKLQNERKVLSLQAQPNNPGLIQLNTQIESVTEALKENIREMTKNTKLTLTEIENRQQIIEKQLEQLPRTERRYVNFQRSFKLNDQIYNFLLQKRADAAIMKASNVADSKILDSASAENAFQISPQTARNKAMALLIGFLIPITVLVILEYFNVRIVDPKDIENNTPVPLLGSIGHNIKKTDLPVIDTPKSSISEAFRALRTNLYYMLHDKEHKVICITSSISGEGKTFSANNLAAIFAQNEQKTLLVGLDMRKPRLHKIFNVSNNSGMSTFLIGKTSFEDTVRQTNIKNLYISVSGPVPPNPAELMDSKAMSDFISKAKDNFDVVVIDTPPLAFVTDAVIMSKFADLTIYVVRQNFTSKDVLKLINDQYLRQNMPHLGILINDVKVSPYSYGKRYSYGYKYEYGYGSGKNAYYGEDDFDELTWKDKVLAWLGRRKV